MLYVVNTGFGYYVAESGQKISPLFATYDEAREFICHERRVDMSDKECCSTCKHHYPDGLDWVCTNPDSDYCADWTEYNDKCEEWEERE